MDYSNHFGLCVKYPKTTNAIKTTNKNKTFHKPKNLNIKNDKTPCCFISYPLHFPPQSQSNHSEIHFPSLYLVYLATKHRHKERERERYRVTELGAKRRERWEWNTREGVEASRIQPNPRFYS